MVAFPSPILIENTGGHVRKNTGSHGSQHVHTKPAAQQRSPFHHGAPYHGADLTQDRAGGTYHLRLGALCRAPTPWAAR